MPPFPEEVRLADWLGSGIVPLTGQADGPPFVPPGHAASTARVLAQRVADATGGRVRADGPALLGERAAFTGHTRAGRVSPGGGARLLSTRDGWAALSCTRPDDPALYGALIGDDPGIDPWSAIAMWVATHTGAELAADATLLGLPAAEVVKVETPTRPDGARRGHPGFYRLLHGGHRAVVVDPATSSGRAQVAALVRSADIIIEASRPRALRGFGLDADAEVARGATWISVTAAGRASDRVGFGDDVAASAGLVAATLDGTPTVLAPDGARPPRHRPLGQPAPLPGADTLDVVGRW